MTTTTNHTDLLVTGSVVELGRAEWDAACRLAADRPEPAHLILKAPALRVSAYLKALAELESGNADDRQELQVDMRQLHGIMMALPSTDGRVLAAWLVSHELWQQGVSLEPRDYAIALARAALWCMLQLGVAACDIGSLLVWSGDRLPDLILAS